VGICGEEFRVREAQIDIHKGEAEATNVMAWDNSTGKTAQQLHDEQMKRKPRFARGSKSKLEATLKDKGKVSPDRSQSDEHDWVGDLVKHNPSLTREKVAEMVEDLGF
jgi:hypothetical protein